MILPDINILVNAHRPEMTDHKLCSEWLKKTLLNSEGIGLAHPIAVGFIRIVTNPRVFINPSSLEEAFGFIDKIQSVANYAFIEPGPNHWKIFENLCKKVNARGNLIPDIYYAALAIENDAMWVTLDRDFAHFPGLKWKRPEI